jgi:Protein of unknown function (DUF1761)
MDNRITAINYWAVIVAALAAFVMSSLYYSPLLAGGIWRAVDPAAAALTFSPWKPLVEIVRTLGITFVMARLLVTSRAKRVAGSLMFALWTWFGFSALMWIGAVVWEGTPWQVAVIHSTDWLLKTLLIAAILGVWR